MNTQFDLGAMLSAPQTAIQQIPCDQLHPYHNHKFELYSGERLEDMVASIEMKKAKMLRASADDEGNIDRYTVESIFSGENGEAKPKPKSVKISNDTYTKYFSEGVKAKEITETIEKALEYYFRNMEEQ